MSPAQSPASPPSNVTARKVSSSSAIAKNLFAQHRNRQMKKLGRNLEKNGTKLMAAIDEQQQVPQEPLYHGFRVPPLLSMDSPSRQLVQEAEANEPLPCGLLKAFPDCQNSTDPDWRFGMNYSSMQAVPANSKSAVANDDAFPRGDATPSNNFIRGGNDPMIPNTAVVLGQDTIMSDHMEGPSDKRAISLVHSDPTLRNMASSTLSTTAKGSRITAMNSSNISSKSRNKATHSGNPTNTSSNIITADTRPQIGTPPTPTDTFRLLKHIRTTVQEHAYRISISRTNTNTPRNKRIVAELSKFLNTADDVEKRLQEIYGEAEKI